jgi:glycerophosphoryl diester phosphodiesterase
MKKVLFILFFICLFSCQKKETNPYIGNWYFDQIVDYDSAKVKFPKIILENEYAPYYNFEILNDSILDFKLGFLYRINGNTGNSKFISQYYLGTETNYKIINSKLVFFNKSNKEWDTIQINKITKDTMIVSRKDNIKYRLIKKRNKYFDTKNYDAITIYRSPCFGNCPFSTTYIDRKGKFYFCGYDSNTENGRFYSNLYTNQIDEIFNGFDKIDINKLKSRYGGYTSCGPTNMISFFKNGKIVKSIECYATTPIDLSRQFSLLSYYYQQVKLNRDDNFMFYENVWYRSFNSQTSSFELKESESFFLEVALRNGKKVNFNFQTKYNLDFTEFYDKSNIKTIITDGRFYKVTQKDNRSFTIDIGYNFLDKNPIIKKNRSY